jgi:regulation of enolase protein 1 (concanavalin A-like superfamily)
MRSGYFGGRSTVLGFLLGSLLLTEAVSAFAQQETWTSGDIGSPALAGSSSYNPANDTFTVRGAGADIWGTADQFQFVYQAVSGNCELVARVVTLQNTNGWAKAGLMLREDLTTGAKNALAAATVSNGVTYQWRYTATASSGFASGGSGAAPVWVKLKRLGDQVTYYRSADGQTWTQIGTQNIAMNSTVYAGLAVTSHNTGALATATFDHVSLTASGIGTLPSPWNDADIGTPGYRGYAVFDGTSIFSVAGGGADIWGTADAFHFLYQPLMGDGAVQARILSQQNTNAWAKAGGMIRESLAPDSKHGMSMYSSVYGMFYQSRSTTGGTTMGLPALGGTAPIWTKVERRGPVIIGWKSLDGATWDWVGSQPVSMGTQAYAGLAVNPHNNGALSLATFDNLQVTAGRANTLPTPWNELMLGSPVLGGWAGFANNTFTLYAGGGDIWGPADQGEFVYRPLNGDGTITLKVANLKNSQEWAKAGIMMRETLSPDAKHVLWGVSPSHGVFLQKRVTTGTTPSNYYDSATVAPVWLKLQRTGNIFTASKSSDGVTWTVFGTETVPMDVNIYAGAVLSSPSTTVIGQADIPTLTMTAPSAHNYSPLAWWPMNEGSGTTLLDASGGQHNATVSGTMTRTSGHDGSGGINLPSGDATAYVTTQTLMSGTSSLSVSAWFKTTDSGVRRIISKGHWGATTGFLLGIGHSAPGRLTFGIGGGTAAQSVLMSTTESFNNGAWHHVVGVYDSAAHTARIYVDGTLRNVALTGSIWGGTIIENGKALDTSALTQLSTTSNIALHVGSYNGQYERWVGELDDVRLYATALDDLDVQSLYADDGLPASWKQKIVDFSTTDSITSVSQVHPGDDFDHDGLTNQQEYQAGLDPTNPDSDYDGVSDKQEQIDGTNPLDPASVAQKRIAYFPFDDASFTSHEGQTPSPVPGMTQATSVAGFSGNAMHVDQMGQLLRYEWVRPDGSPNYSIRRGTMRMWFKLDWYPAPGATNDYMSCLFALGALGYSREELAIFYDNPMFDFFSGSDTMHRYETLSSFSGVSAGQWHQVVVTYSPTSEKIYLDGVFLAQRTVWVDGQRIDPASPVNWTTLPKVADFNVGGFKFGSDGSQPLRGAVDEAEFFNYELTPEDIQSQYAAVHNNPPDSWKQKVVDFSTTDSIASVSQVLPGDDFDHDGLTNLQEYQASLDPTNPDSDYDGVSDKQEQIDGTNPLDPASVTQKRIAYFPMDAPTFASNEGQVPRATTGVTSVLGWKGNAARIDANGDTLTYDWIRPNGSLNYSFTSGTVRLWIKPDWSSTQMSSTYSRLFEIGGPWGMGKAYSLLRLHASQPTMAIAEADGNGHYLDYETVTPFDWAAGSWHQVVFTYSPTGRKFYVDGVLVGQTALPWIPSPKIADILAAGLTLGNESVGFQPIYGALDEIEFFNYELPATQIQADYVAADTDHDGIGDEQEMALFGNLSHDRWTDTDGDGVSDVDEVNAGTNWNDFWNGQPPTLTVTYGDQQVGAPNTFLPEPLMVQVANSNHAPYVGGSVTYTVTSGGGTLQLTSNGTSATTQTRATDSNGETKVYFKTPATANATMTITATFGTKTATFTETTGSADIAAAGSPFAPLHMHGVINADGSTDITWDPNPDDDSGGPVPFWRTYSDGTKVKIGEAPSTATSYHIPPQE